jgi:outer membrane protein
MRLKLLSSLIATALAAQVAQVAHSADLLSLYREAATQDPAVAAAQASLQAARERVAQAEAAAGLSAGVTATAASGYGDNSAVRGVERLRTDRGTINGSVTASVSKPLVRSSLRVNIDQARAAVTLSDISLAQARQDLATRVSQAYFDVLLAQDNVVLVGAQKAAVAEQLAQARRNFEVGTATIVDTNEAQARYDQVIAQEIAAMNELDRTRWALRNTVGRYETNLVGLNKSVAIDAPTPSNMEAWVTRAERDAFLVRLAQQSFTVTEYDVKRAQTGKDWTLDASVSATHSQNTSGTFSGGSYGTNGQIGLSFFMPFDISGAVDARVREAIANVEKSRNDIETARRGAALSVRQSFLGVTSGIASVAAQEQALKSAETLVASTKLGLEVGVRTNLDVLNAQQTLTQVQRDLAQARYNALLNRLRLEAAAGDLNEDDIRTINGYLRN